MNHFVNIKMANKIIKNCVNHDIALFACDDLTTDRLQHVRAKKGAKPRIIIPQEYPLNISTYGLPVAIDEMNVIGNCEECQVIAPPASEWTDVMVVSVKYWLGIAKEMIQNNGIPGNNIHPFFTDRLWIAEPVYSPISEGKPKVIGSYLKKAIRPLRPDVYVNFLRNNPTWTPSRIAVKAALDCYTENRQPDTMTPYVQELKRWYNETIRVTETTFPTTPETVTFEA